MLTKPWIWSPKDLSLSAMTWAESLSRRWAYPFNVFVKWSYHFVPRSDTLTSFGCSGAIYCEKGGKISINCGRYGSPGTIKAFSENCTTHIWKSWSWLICKIFFETPHRSSKEKSWESLANWLLLVSGVNGLFTLDWIRGTAKMIKSQCLGFRSSERLYRVINIYYGPTSSLPHKGINGYRPVSEIRHERYLISAFWTEMLTQTLCSF